MLDLMLIPYIFATTCSHFYLHACAVLLLVIFLRLSLFMSMLEQMQRYDIAHFMASYQGKLGHYFQGGVLQGDTVQQAQAWPPWALHQEASVREASVQEASVREAYIQEASVQEAEDPESYREEGFDVVEADEHLDFPD